MPRRQASLSLWSRRRPGSSGLLSSWRITLRRGPNYPTRILLVLGVLAILCATVTIALFEVLVLFTPDAALFYLPSLIQVVGTSLVLGGGVLVILEMARMIRCPKCAREVRLARGVPYCVGCNRRIPYCVCESLNTRLGDASP